MTKTFTENELIRFLYNELDQQERYEIESALATDDVLRDNFHQLKKTVEALDQVKLSPPANVIDKILDFSRGHEEEQVTRSYRG